MPLKRNKNIYLTFSVFFPQMCAQKTWTPQQYQEDKNNCYSFVLTFLQSLNYGVLSKTAFSRLVCSTSTVSFTICPAHCSIKKLCAVTTAIQFVGSLGLPHTGLHLQLWWICILNFHILLANLISFRAFYFLNTAFI